MSQYDDGYFVGYLLNKFRRIMDYIHFGGSIWYDAGRFKAYSLVAQISSEVNNNGKEGD